MTTSKDAQLCSLQRRLLLLNAMVFTKLSRSRDNKVKTPKSSWIKTLDQ